MTINELTKGTALIQNNAKDGCLLPVVPFSKK